MNALLLLLALSSVIVLRSGDRITVEGPVKQEKGVVTFKTGRLFYSLPAEEIEKILPADQATPEEKAEAKKVEPAKKAAAEMPRRLRASEEERKRLLAELEQNHGGEPAPPQKILQEPPPAPTRAEVAAEKREESQWRSQARDHEEAIRRANEDLALLETRVTELENKIHSLVALGYKPHQFTYDSDLLIRTREQLPYAQLEVTRAERAYAQFKEDARREGVPPGWLR